MSTKKQMLYTEEGYKVLIDELNYLKTVRREEIQETIRLRPRRESRSLRSSLKTQSLSMRLSLIQALFLSVPL